MGPYLSRLNEDVIIHLGARLRPASTNRLCSTCKALRALAPTLYRQNDVLLRAILNNDPVTGRKIADFLRFLANQQYERIERAHYTRTSMKIIRDFKRVYHTITDRACFAITKRGQERGWNEVILVLYKAVCLIDVAYLEGVRDPKTFQSRVQIIAIRNNHGSFKFWGYGEWGEEGYDYDTDDSEASTDLGFEGSDVRETLNDNSTMSGEDDNGEILGVRVSKRGWVVPLM
jgi:hypothetical protein